MISIKYSLGLFFRDKKTVRKVRSIITSLKDCSMGTKNGKPYMKVIESVVM